MDVPRYLFICRCMPVNGSTNTIGLCGSHYSSEDEYFNDSEISGLQTALQTINDTFQNNNNNSCVSLMIEYLCHYYFPPCDPVSGEIIPVCSSCALLANNENCYELREIANNELEIENVIPPDDGCIQTYHSYVNPPAVSDSCSSIEG